MRGLSAVVPAVVCALLSSGCGSDEQHTTEQLLLRWSISLNHHLATDIAGGNQYPRRLSEVDPQLRSDVSFDDGWGRPLHYRRVNDSLYDLVSAGTIPSIRVASAGSRRGRILIIATGLMEFIDRLRTGTLPAARPRMDVDAIIDRTRPGGASTGRRPRG